MGQDGVHEGRSWVCESAKSALMERWRGLPSAGESGSGSERPENEPDPPALVAGLFTMSPSDKYRFFTCSPGSIPDTLRR